MWWILRALWLIVAHDLLLEYRYTGWGHRKLECFSLSMIYSTWRTVFKMLWVSFGLSKCKPQKKFEGSYLQLRWKNGETETERVLEDLKIPKLEEIFTTVAIWRGVIATRDSQFWNYFRDYFALSKWRRWNFSEKLYTSKIKRKRRSRDEK